MTEPLQYKGIICPWCFESLEIEVDLSAGNQAYTEDCQICCAPIALTIQLNDDDIDCTVQRE